MSVLATLIAVLSLRHHVHPMNLISTVNLLALGSLFAGIASAACGTVGGKIVGIFGIFVGIIVLIFPDIVGVLVIFTGVAVNISKSRLLPRKRRSTDYTVLDNLRIGADNFRDHGEMDIAHAFWG